MLPSSSVVSATPRIASAEHGGRRTHAFVRIVTAAVLAATCASASAQFTQNFDDFNSLPSSGWFLQNNSSPLGTLSWFQGLPTNATPVPGPFDAWNGAANSYIGVDYNSAANIGTISNWLLTPNITLRNGDVFQFYTRQRTPPPGLPEYADRLEVRMSTNGASTNVGVGDGGLGDFTSLLLSINPTLVTGVYPKVWTQYTITVSGLPAPTSGRFGFRYFVTLGGPLGNNSDYIGIDNAVYTPYTCPTLSLSPSSLPNTDWGQAYNQSLSQTGALGAPIYAIIAGALPPGLTLSISGTISGTPNAPGTFNFTAGVADNSGCSTTRSYAITVSPVVPQAPSNVVAVAGDAYADVTWNAPGDGGDAITGYTATCTDGTNPVSVNGDLPSIHLPGLANGHAYACTVVATNGIGTGAASAPSKSVTPMGNQTITFTTQSSQTYAPGGSFGLDPPAMASSGLAVIYGSATPTVCDFLGGNTFSILAGGTCTITADQPGDVAWNPAPQAAQTFAIDPASQSLTFPQQTETTRWFHAGTTFAISPQATSADPNSGQAILYSSLATGVCSVSGTTVTMVSAGVCILAAGQAGDGNFLPAKQAVAAVVLNAPTQADLWIENSVDHPVVLVGDTVAYTILLGNSGEADTANVRVQDAPPDRIDAASVSWQCLEATGTVCPVPVSGTGLLDVTIASLPKDAGLRFELVGDVIAATDPADEYLEFFNTATIALPPGSGLTDPTGNNSSSVGVRVSDLLFVDGFDPSTP